MEANRLIVGLLIVGFLLVPIGVAASNYSISTDAEHDVPDRDVDFEGDTYTISKISRVDEGDELEVETDGPDDGYEVQTRDPDNSIIEARTVGGGEATLTFDMPPSDQDQIGSWAVVIVDGDLKKIHPVIIKAYDVSHSGPSSVEEGESFDVTVEVTELSDEKDINYVEVVLANDIEDETVEATKTNGDYEATVSTDDLGTGQYSLYATVRGNKEVRDRDELLGFSDQTTVTIEAPTPTPTPSDDGGGGGGGGGGLATPEGTPDGTPEGTPDGTPEGTPDDETDDQPAEIDADPDREAQAEIQDADAESPGVTVDFEDTESVRRVTFNDESVEGSVSVAEYDEAPESVDNSISERYSDDSGTSDTDAGPNVAQVVDVSPSSDAARQSPATIEISVPREELSTPDNAAILHEQSDGSWVRLITDVQATTDETVTLEANIQSFSLFAVVDESTVTPTPIQASTPTPTPTPTPTTADSATTTMTQTATPTQDSVVTPQPSASPTQTPGESGPGFTVGMVLFAFLASGTALVRRIR